MIAARAGLDSAGLAVLGEALADGVVVIDGHGQVCWANTAAGRLIGESVDHWIGRAGLELVHPDDLELAALSLVSVQGKAVGSPIELRIRSQMGWRLVEVVGSRYVDEHIVLVMRDLTERRRWEIAGDDIARFRSLLHNAAGLTVLLDRNGRVLSASAAITRTLGHDPEVVGGSPFADLVASDDRPAFEQALSEAVMRPSGGTAATVEVNLCTRGGLNIPFELSIVSLLDDPTVEGLVLSGHDITRLRIAQTALAELATHDSLTGLLNRGSFDEALLREWELTSRDGIDSYVVVIDLNGFKHLNDSHGHSAGDDALRQVVRALHAAARTTDVLGRLGGDEFGVLLVRCGGEAAALGFQARLCDELEREAWPGGKALTAALGYHSLKTALSPAGALHAADLAMLASKPRRSR